LILDAAARVLERLHVRGAEHARGALERGALLLDGGGARHEQAQSDQERGELAHVGNLLVGPIGV
jgi:hypothetical protein